MIYEVTNMKGYVLLYAGVHGGVAVCTGVWVCTGVRGYVPVCLSVWDEFLKYLLETRFLTSANYNMHPFQILL